MVSPPDCVTPADRMVLRSRVSRRAIILSVPLLAGAQGKSSVGSHEQFGLVEIDAKDHAGHIADDEILPISNRTLDGQQIRA